ncbi:MAG: HEAT repeat domain-containing protein [Nitrospirota bacterium]
MIEGERLSQLLSDLSHPDSTHRRAAAEALADGDERVLYSLIKALRDENPGVQDAAMRALIAIGGETTAYMVLPLLREGPLLRNTTLVILKEIGSPVSPLLRLLFADKDDDIRKFAVDLAGDIKTCDYPEEIVKLLQIDPNVNVRAAAAKALALLNCRNAVPALIAALRDEEWVCFSALDALGQFGDELSLEPVHALLGNAATVIRYAAIETLGKIGSVRASRILFDYLPKADPTEKNAVIKSLVQIGLTPSMISIREELLNMLQNGEWEERIIAIRGLAELQEKQAIPKIIDIAGQLDSSDPQDEERLHAVKEALMDFGCVPAFLEVLDSLSIKYRGKVIALEILKDLNYTDALPHIIPLLGVVSTHVVLAAVDAIMELNEQEAPQILSSLRQHDDSMVRERVNWLLEGVS